MKFKIPILLFFCILSFNSKAQYYYYDDKYYDNELTFEAGISLGPMNSLTDIGGRKGNGKGGAKDLNVKSTTFSGGIYFSGLYKHFLGLRLEGTFGKVESNDSLLVGVKSTAIGRYNRNLSFRSPISELSLLAEFYPVQFFQIFEPWMHATAFSPYILGGIGVFQFNPQANLNGQWIDLQPLHTEGQGFVEYPERKQYGLTKMNFSYGVGLAYELSAKFDLKIEYVSRVLTTDYLDDVHSRYINPNVFSKYFTGTQLADALLLNNRGRPDAMPRENTNHPDGIRGNSENNDSYFTINIKVGYIIGRKKISGGTSRSFRNQFKSPRLF
jgi:hypothetical protein